MARAVCSVDTGAVSYTATTTKTLVSVTAPANQAVAWLRLVISAEGVQSTDKPALVEWGVVSGGTGTAATEQPVTVPGIAIGSFTPQATALTAYSVEPSFTPRGSVYVHLQSGYERVFQRGQDEVAYINSIWGVRVTNPTDNSTTNVRATLEWEE